MVTAAKIEDGSSQTEVTYVEQCTCPDPYSGDHCERCSAGYMSISLLNDTHDCLCASKSNDNAACNCIQGGCFTAFLIIHTIYYRSPP